MENEEEQDVYENVDYEPEVTSNNPTERIMARRFRIQRRVEALRKQQELKEAQEKAGDATLEVEVEKTSVELQVEKSIELLEKLVLEGDEYVTNVRVATEAREADRREREGIGKEKLLKELEEEGAAAEAMFTEIADKWSGILKYNDPLHINEDIISQKEKCDELIRQKDTIIANLKDKLRKAEINFSADQKKQIEDINSIARRIENQIIIMRKAFKQELQMIEEVVFAERQLIVETSNKKWDELYKKRDQEEKSNAELRSEDYWTFVKEMDNLNLNFQELYRDATIKLENDCDELQRDLERIKTDAIMNSEKLDYNYQILKKREDENLIIRSQQKRRMNKLQDLINSLRKKNIQYRTQTFQQIDKLTEEIKKLSQNILDIEKKADHMAAVNNEKFRKIWNMNKKRADDLFHKILDIDKVLCEQQLGLVWKAPEHELPDKMEMTNPRAAAVAISRTRQKKVSIAMTEIERQSQGEPQNEENPMYRKILQHILNLIADKTGFLIEDQLYSILQPYMEHEQTMIKVDSVFEALHLSDKNDVDLLLEYFLPYMFCPVCNVPGEKSQHAIEDEYLMRVHEMDTVNLADLAQNDSREEETSMELLRESAGLDHEQGTLVEVGPLAVTVYDDNMQGECKGPDIPDARASSDFVTSPMGTLGDLRPIPGIPCHYQHPIMISSVYVLRALKDFLAKYHIPKGSLPTMSTRLSHKRNTVSRLLNPEDIENFWRKYLELFPKERVQLWDSLLEGLKKYHELLKMRKSTSQEVVSLRKQNAELRRVFANYIDQKDIPY